MCDLPHLPADQVETAIAEHYATLRLPDDFRASVRRLLDETLADEQSSVRTMHATLAARLAELDAKEERLLDLAGDGTLAQAKIKARLRAIESDRAHVQLRFGAVEAELAVGVDVIIQALDLLANPCELYPTHTDDVRRQLNRAFFEYLYLDIDGVKTDQLHQPFADLHGTMGARTGRDRLPTSSADDWPRDAKSGPTLREVLVDPGSSKAAVVELPGIEPGSSAASSGLLRVQFAMPLLGSPSLANKPG